MNATNKTSSSPGSGSDQRRYRRRPVLWKGTVEIARHKLECLVKNVTPAGMLVELDLPLAAGAALRVVLPDSRPLAARIAWSSGPAHGLAFTDPEDDVLAALGRRAASLGFPAPREARA
ncbi:PilZ domain-containing protein [Pedomonas sp. V897]|uniref:PilZ domain-containing protein n=1 Tax=Pedomonas sp. V897 TaxID=3446482 RepID=UPI003EE1275F